MLDAGTLRLGMPAGGGQLYRLGAGAFITTGEGREQASYRIVDLTTYC
ncbi:hypothetical protein [Massilia sp. CT11-137]